MHEILEAFYSSSIHARALSACGFRTPSPGMALLVMNCLSRFFPNFFHKDKSP